MNIFLSSTLLVFIGSLVFLIVKEVSKRKRRKDISKNVFFKEFSDKKVSEISKDGEKIFKQTFHPSKVPEKIDAIVIGSGVSGLVCASFLAKEGKKVLVLEKHKKAGGYTHCFNKKGYSFCGGLHYLSDVSSGGIFETIFDYVGEGLLKMKKLEKIFDQLYVKETNEVYQTVYPLKDYETYLKSRFPLERENIEFFLCEVRKCLREQSDIIQLRFVPVFLRWFMIHVLGKGKTFLKYSKVSISDVMDRLFRNEDLKLCLSYFVFLVGETTDAPASMVMTTLGSYTKSAHYPEHGPIMFSKSMCKTIEKYGGKVLCKANVEKIETNAKGKAVIGVRVKGFEDHLIQSNIVVGAAGVYNNLKCCGIRNEEELNRLYTPSCSHFYLFLGFKGDPEKLKIPKSNIWSFENFDLNIRQPQPQPQKEKEEEEEEEEEEEIMKTLPGMCIVFNHHVCPLIIKKEEEEKKKKFCCTAMIPCPSYQLFEQWEDQRIKHRGNDYKERKHLIEEKMLERFFEMFPRLRNRLDYVDSATSLSAKHYVNYPQGESYGLKASRRVNFENCELKSKEVEGLYFTGTDYSVMTGVLSATFTGMLTAQEILKKNFVQQCIQKMKYEKEKKKEMMKNFTELANEMKNGY